MFKHQQKLKSYSINQFSQSAFNSIITMLCLLFQCSCVSNEHKRFPIALQVHLLGRAVVVALMPKRAPPRTVRSHQRKLINRTLTSQHGTGFVVERIANPLSSRGPLAATVSQKRVRSDAKFVLVNEEIFASQTTSLLIRGVQRLKFGGFVRYYWHLQLVVVSSAFVN